jgi:hypothetical protein
MFYGTITDKLTDIQIGCEHLDGLRMSLNLEDSTQLPLNIQQQAQTVIDYLNDCDFRGLADNIRDLLALINYYA